MSNINSESLFSLEIVVNKLKLHEDIRCRFPAIAFRLLDFPTLFISYLQPHHEKVIKENINPNQNIPVQFPNLLDIDRTYVFLRGKSSLFKSTASQLLTDLRTAPVFIMIIDCFDDNRPRLVGNGRILLEDVMSRLYASIEIGGLSFPVFEGEKDILPLFDLMGKTIGSIDVGYRILSLGSTLFRHIPELQEIQQIDVNREPLSRLDSFWKDTAIQDHEIMLEPIFENTVSQVKNVNTSSPKYVNKNIETMNKTFLNNSVQTKVIKTKRSEDYYLDNLMDISNPNLSNLDNPPPLFYNSCFEEKNKLIESSAISYTNINEPLFIDDHYCEEDIQVDVKSTFIDKKLQKQKIMKDKKVLKQKQIPSDGYPILRALFSEIMNLQDEPFPFEKRIKMNIETFENNFTEKSSLEQKRSASHHCVDKQKRLSKNQSWLKPYKKEPSAPSNNCFITAGLTRTQKLRLKDKNPKELKKAVKMENERLTVWRNKFNAMRNKSISCDNGNFVSFDDNDFLRKNQPSTFKKPIPTPRLSIKDSNSHKQLISDHLKKVSDKPTSVFDQDPAGDILHSKIDFNNKLKHGKRTNKNKPIMLAENLGYKNNGKELQSQDIQLEQYIDPLSAFFEDSDIDLKNNKDPKKSNKKIPKQDVNLETAIENYVENVNVLNASKLSDQSFEENYEEYRKIKESTGSQLTDETDTNTTKTLKISKQYDDGINRNQVKNENPSSEATVRNINTNKETDRKIIEGEIKPLITQSADDNKETDREIIDAEMNPLITLSNDENKFDLNHLQRYVEVYSSDTEWDLLDRTEIRINKSTDSEINSIEDKDSISSLPLKSKTTNYLNTDKELGLKGSKMPYKKQEKGILKSNPIKTPRTPKTINSVSFTASYSQSFENISDNENDAESIDNRGTEIETGEIPEISIDTREIPEVSIDELDFNNSSDESNEHNTNSNNSNLLFNKRQLFSRKSKMTTERLRQSKTSNGITANKNNKILNKVSNNTEKISNTEGSKDSDNITEISDIAGIDDFSLLSNMTSSGREVVKQLSEIKLDDNAMFAYTWHYK